MKVYMSPLYKRSLGTSGVLVSCNRTRWFAAVHIPGHGATKINWRVSSLSCSRLWSSNLQVVDRAARASSALMMQPRCWKPWPDQLMRMNTTVCHVATARASRRRTWLQANPETPTERCMICVSWLSCHRDQRLLRGVVAVLVMLLGQIPRH